MTRAYPSPYAVQALRVKLRQAGRVHPAARHRDCTGTTHTHSLSVARPADSPLAPRGSIPSFRPDMYLYSLALVLASTSSSSSVGIWHSRARAARHGNQPYLARTRAGHTDHHDGLPIVCASMQTWTTHWQLHLLSLS